MNQQTLLESVIIPLATLTDSDRELIQKCRRSHNRLGFSYQLMFVKVFNQFLSQEPLSIQHQILRVHFRTNLAGTLFSAKK